MLDMISIEIDLYIARIFKNKNVYYHETKACENKIIIAYLNCIFFSIIMIFQKLNDWYPVFCCEIEGKIR
jgi:hypothetical protein